MKNQKIRKVLIFLQKEGKIINLNSDVIKLFEQFLNNYCFENKEFLFKIQNLYNKIDKYYSFQNFCYDKQVEKIVKHVKIALLENKIDKSNYFQQFEVVMFLKLENFSDYQIMDYINSNFELNKLIKMNMILEKQEQNIQKHAKRKILKIMLFLVLNLIFLFVFQDLVLNEKTNFEILILSILKVISLTVSVVLVIMFFKNYSKLKTFVSLNIKQFLSFHITLTIIYFIVLYTKIFIKSEPFFLNINQSRLNFFLKYPLESLFLIINIILFICFWNYNNKNKIKEIIGEIWQK